MTSGGETIGGRYRLDELLGHGAMSEVWRGHDLELDRTVAVKLLAPTADPTRFQREARAVAALAHENVTQVFDCGEEGDRPYMVLEHLPGGTLEERLTPGEPLPPADAEAVTTGIAAGLAHAHARGVVHRDLKPANVLFDEEGRPKLADFGIARRAAAEHTLTEAGTVIGTASYLSPEQAAGEPAGPASDVYSLGVIAFLLLTGRLPFVSDDAMELAAMHRSTPPPPLGPLAEGVSPSLVAFTEAALAKDPAARPADGAAALAVLARGATPPTPATMATQVLPPTAAASMAGPPRRRGRTLLVATALVALALAGAALAWIVTRPSSASTPN
ncbi:MAG TPA: serine/threonine-protein kinase, partial [Gaiellaceae bacterium]|nr:serine/threonine-protein kinase [Gaiellaceae bacterium]